jgi:hypothetical protein
MKFLTLADWTGIVETELFSTLNQEPSTFSPVTATVACRVEAA